MVSVEVTYIHLVKRVDSSFELSEISEQNLKMEAEMGTISELRTQHLMVHVSKSRNRRHTLANLR